MSLPLVGFKLTSDPISGSTFVSIEFGYLVWISAICYGLYMLAEHVYKKMHPEKTIYMSFCDMIENLDAMTLVNILTQINAMVPLLMPNSPAKPNFNTSPMDMPKRARDVIPTELKSFDFPTEKKISTKNEEPVKNSENVTSTVNNDVKMVQEKVSPHADAGAITIDDDWFARAVGSVNQEPILKQSKDEDEEEEDKDKQN